MFERMIRSGPRALMAAALCVGVAAAAAGAFAQTEPMSRLRACVAEKRAVYLAPQPFESSELTLTCNGADLVGFPPREQRDVREQLVTHRASDGYRIIPGSVSICGEAGSTRPVTVTADGAAAQAPLSCRGGGVGAAPITVSLRLCGQEKRVDTPALESAWLTECARELRRR